METGLMEQMDYLDVKALMYLCIEFQTLPSVRNLVDMYPFESKHWQKAMNSLRFIDFNKTEDEVSNRISELLPRAMSEEERGLFLESLSIVLQDFKRTVPRGLGRTIDEPNMVVEADIPMECDVCGEVIKAGEEVYIRTEPVKATRHVMCNNTIRWQYEYSQIEYYIREIEYFEDLFSREENTTYVLDKSLTHQVFKKAGFMTDVQGRITRLPNFSDFVLEYISGMSDYELMKKYRPYHVYIQFLLNMKGCTDRQISSMGGYKYLLRESRGRWAYPALCEDIEKTAYSELFSYDPIYSAVDSEVKKIIHSVAIRRLLEDASVVIDDSRLMHNGEEKTYSIEEDDGSDIYISADRLGVFCTDSETSCPIKEYFRLGPDADPILDYIKKFEESS